MNGLEKLGYKIHDITDSSVTYIREVDKGYEEHYVKINFNEKTIETMGRYNSSGFTYIDGGVSLEVMEAAIDILNARKVELVWE